MAISAIKLVYIFFILSIVVPSFAKEYVVGGRKGWSPGVDYHHWAYGKSFRIGDVLRFIYHPKLTDVASVDISSYALCDGVKTYTKDNSGRTSITLDNSGAYYFISTNQTRCSSGLKLELHVV
ncbi:basic blue protein-like [Nicotiana tabacum]|uniref:Basic blue protein-like n=2 Tax=Nicotiana TaxID=4085 RepID=A0A1S4AN59_TOBAC|nr:PREDICTED: blue copper protein-like [Nicotiana sylvestris]XP_016478096.1 PREDICTED: blue copper protein-like [Nicotiana tabacum]